MYTRNLYNEVVQRHNFNGANELEIMGGFVGPSPVKSLTETDLNCRIVYGCLQSGKVSEKLHQQFLRATKSSKKRTSVVCNQPGGSCKYPSKENAISASSPEEGPL